MNRLSSHKAMGILFFLSGFSALIYQVVWHRVLTQIIGVDALSITFIVTIFMAGLGLGTFYSAFIVQTFKNKLRTAYVAIEVLTGLYGLLSIPLLRILNQMVIPIAPDSIWFDFIFNLLLLFLPTFLMGTTTPIVVELMKQRLSNFGEITGKFYGINTLGAAMGSLFTGFILIELLGLQGSAVVAAIINLVVGISFYRIFTSGVVFSDDTEENSSKLRMATIFNLDKKLIIAAVLFGFTTLSIEMVFFRILTNYLTLSSYVYPILLSSYLTLMAIGNFLGGKEIDKNEGTQERITLVSRLLLASALLITIATLLPPSWVTPIGGMVFTSFSGQLVNMHPEVTIGDPNLLVAFLFSSFMMLSIIPLSALFPIVVRVAAERIEVAGGRFATVLFWFTLGNILGASITGLILFGRFQTIGSIRVISIVLGIGVFFLLTHLAKQKTLLLRSAITIVVSLTIMNLVLPTNYYLRFSYKGYQPIDAIEGTNGVVSVVPTNRFYTIIDMFRTASASAIKHQPAAGEEYEPWRWNLSELMALDPTFRPKRILIIGLGHGYMVSALLQYDFVEEIVVVDISDEIVDAVYRYSALEFRDFFDDPRVKIVIEDGRKYIQEAITQGERFDLVQNKVNEPWHSGSSNLFTEEFFQATKEILNPTGYLALRHHESHAATGLKVFDTAIWTGYYHVYLTDKDFQDTETASVTEELFGPFVSAHIGGTGEGEDARSALEVLILEDGDLPGYVINQDNFPIYEYYILNNLFSIHPDPRTLFSLEAWAERIQHMPVVYRGE